MRVPLAQEDAAKGPNWKGLGSSALGAVALWAVWGVPIPPIAAGVLFVGFMALCLACWHESRQLRRHEEQLRMQEKQLRMLSRLVELHAGAGQLVVTPAEAIEWFNREDR